MNSYKRLSVGDTYRGAEVIAIRMGLNNKKKESVMVDCIVDNNKKTFSYFTYKDYFMGFSNACRK